MSRGTLRVRIVGDASHLQRTLGNATGGIARFAKAGLLALGAAAVTGIAMSVKAFADFDQAMTRSTAIMGDVSDAMRKDMADAAREVAKTTAFSATEAAESYFFLASAGLDAAASIEALPKVAAFAQAGAFDMARATDLLTDSQSALGMVVDDTAENIANMVRVSDVLVKANTLANASVEEFSEALTEKAGAALRQLNKDVEEGVAVLAVYADQGTKGSAAGTLLNSVLEGLTRTARTNADAYKDLGVAVFDSEGEMRNMADIVGDLETGLKGMSTEQQLAELATLGLTRTARDGVVQLLGNADAIREYEKELRNAGGTTEDVADRQMQTFWAQLGLLKDQLVDVGLSIGEALMPHLMNFVGWMQDNMPLVEAIILDVIDAFSLLFGGARVSTQDTTKVIDDETERWAGSYRSASNSVMGYMDDWADHQAGVMGDVEVQFTAISDFVEKELVPAFESIRDWWATNGDTVVSTVNSVGRGVGAVFNGIGATIEWLVNYTRGAMDFWTKILMGSAYAVTRLQNRVRDTMANIRRYIDLVIGTLKALEATARGVVDAVARQLARLPGVGEPLIPRMEGVGSRIMGGLNRGLTSGADTVRSTLSRITSSIPSWKGPESVDRRLLEGPAEWIIGGFSDDLAAQARRQLAPVLADIGRMVPAAMPEPAGRGGDGAALLSPPSPQSMMEGRSDRLLTLRIDSAGSALDDALVEVLRKAVRTRGGDVQVVLGGG